MKKIRYGGEHTRKISFPLGGIGTGCVGLAGDGSLIDWEIFNRPNKNSDNSFSFFAIKAAHDGTLLDARTLLADPLSPLPGAGDRQAPPDGSRAHEAETIIRSHAPCFPAADFISSFPMAEMDFSHKQFPARVHLTAFNPFIPANDADSSIPAAFFEYEIENITDLPLDFTLCCVLNNPLPGTKNTFGHDGRGEVKYVRLSSADRTVSASKKGELCVATDANDVSFQEYWRRGGPADGFAAFWDDFTQNASFQNRVYDSGGTNDRCALAAHVHIAPGETRGVRFILSWHFPVCINYWNPIPRETGETDEGFEEKNSWKNFYTRYFSDAADCAVYCLSQWDRMESDTNLFRTALFTSTLPDGIIDAVGANLAILKSPTCMRNYDGSFYGFEGCLRQSGFGEGSCTHVWNYAYALPFLFPALARSMRVNDYTYNQNPDGAMCFRIPMPQGRTPDSYFPCPDGQFGGVLKVYREFKISGDVDWLIELWPSVRRAIEFAWAADNPFRWDRDHNGVLGGRQFHTLGAELFGPNAWLCGMYLAALKAGRELALVVRDKKRHAEYAALFEEGRAWMEQNLFNGRYYAQKIDLADQNELSGYEFDLPGYAYDITEGIPAAATAGAPGNDNAPEDPDTAPEDTAGDHTVPDGTARDHTVPDGTARDYTAQEDTARDHTAQDGTAGDHTAQDGTARDYTAQDGTAGDHTAQDGTARDYTAQDGTAGDHTAPEDPLKQYYWDKRAGEIKYQIGGGCAIDQLLAQWHANLIGLGEIFDKERARAALSAIYDLNFKGTANFRPCGGPHMPDDGAGAVTCAYPEGMTPAFALPRAREYINGLEYQAACHMIQEGMTDQGLDIVRAVRSRYDGAKRNPFAEQEYAVSCARSMASFALLCAACGFEFDMHKKLLGFTPVMRFADDGGTFQCLFALEGGYGMVEQGPGYIQVKMLTGQIKVKYFKCPSPPLRVYYAGRAREFEREGNTALLGNELPLNTEKDLLVVL